MLFRLGILAIIASFLPWLAIALAPLVGLSLGGAAGFVVVAEVLFWTGLALAGKDTWRAVKANGWRHAPRALARLVTHGRPPSAHA